MRARPTLLLADDHRLILDALERVLQGPYQVVGMAATGPELLAQATVARPEVIISDLSLPLLNSLDALRQLRRRGVSSKFVVLTVHALSSVAAEAFRAGASAYVLKQAPLEELTAALEAVVRGRAYVSSQLPADLLTLLIEDARRGPGPGPRLTRRQRQVLQMVAEGKTMKEAAALLGISARTAESYKYDLMRNRGLRSNAELIQFAIRVGLLAMPPLDTAA